MGQTERSALRRALPPKMALVFAAVYRKDDELVSVGFIRDYVWEWAHISYDQTNHYLTRLMKVGLVERPKRGYYRAVDHGR